jgi:tRNA (guanine37-N1)-methyltransferase
MVMRVDAAARAIEHAKHNDPTARVVLFSPRGRVLRQPLVREIADECRAKPRGLILLCPRYEGVDERIADRFVDLELSLGDFILMGGEVAAMALVEAITRLFPAVLNNPESTICESFENGLLEYPQYTKPQEFGSLTVPPVLLSGNHAEIERWRREQSLHDTRERRPDLLRAPLRPAGEVSLALIHYPVMDKRGDIITSSLTNIDLHDLARSAKTYGIEHFYVVHPVRMIRKLAEKICDHWEQGYGFTYNPSRSEALATASLVPDLDDVLLDIENRCGTLPKLVTTSARPTLRQIGYPEFRAHLMRSPEPHLILLGTGWGLAPSLLERSEYHLEPVIGPTDYNHLSVRAAGAIILDKLFGKQ